MEKNEKVMDISETEIGNYGAKMCGAVISLCEGLEEIRLIKCNIKDEGAIHIFEELKHNDSVRILDLSNNPISEKVFESLIHCLQSNKKIERVELRGLQMKSKFTLNRLKHFGTRVVLWR